MCIRVKGKKKLPGNWHPFLREDRNKAALFILLSDSVTNGTFPGLVLITHGKELRCLKAINEEGLSTCTHEEADSWMLLHTVDRAIKGGKRIMVRTLSVDTEVVLAVSIVKRLLPCEQLLVSVGMGKTFLYVNATHIAGTLGNNKSESLPAYHELTRVN